MGGVDLPRVVEQKIGPARTRHLRGLVETWMDFQQTRKSMAQRELPNEITERMQNAEQYVSAQIKKALREHPLWPWLSQYPGLGGVHTARLIARIADPQRFPGQKCSNGHIAAPLYEEGGECPKVIWTDQVETPCDGIMLEPRPGTGVRSVWHFCGLHVVDGRSPQKRRGQQADWDPIARASVLQPDGIADQIIKQRVPKYRDIYDEQKERLARERGAEALFVSDARAGLADEHPESDIEDGEAERKFEADTHTGLRPIQIHERARKIAAKAFVGDLLVEWKKLT